MTNHTGKRWDIFCKIVDNFGDIGVCWRLSQQLVNEHHIQARLIIDDIHVAKKIIPDLDISKPDQIINQVHIKTWNSLETDFTNTNDTDVVLETFGCELPAYYLQQMSPDTIWVNLEYLSAEDWVDDFHAKPSTHPTLGLTKYYFFPGFVEATGGLIREKDLLAQRDAFLNSVESQTGFWQKITGKYSKVAESQDIKISLFCYPQAQIKNLFDALQATKRNISIFIPFSSTITEVSSLYADFKPEEHSVFHHNNLTVYVVPFLSQTKYDHLLWACDFNFVRGEDSWIRAIWAGKPFVWQPYIQTDDTHLHKLNAFLSRYAESATTEIKALIYEMNLSWSGYGTPNITEQQSAIWQQIIERLPSLSQHAKTQTHLLSEQPDLATKLVIFSKNLQKNQV